MLSALRMLTLACALAVVSVPAAVGEDIGWPRSFEADGHTVVVHQPQVEEWKDHETLEFLMAVSVLPAGADHRTYGIIEVHANTKVNHEERSVLLTRLVLTMQFPDTDAATAEGLETIVRTALPDKETLVVDLDRLIACGDENHGILRHVQDLPELDRGEALWMRRRARHDSTPHATHFLTEFQKPEHYQIYGRIGCAKRRIAVAGALLAEGVPELEQALGADGGCLELDLSDLRFADGDGVAALRRLIDNGTIAIGALPFIENLLAI